MSVYVVAKGERLRFKDQYYSEGQEVPGVSKQIAEESNGVLILKPKNSGSNEQGSESIIAGLKQELSNTKGAKTKAENKVASLEIAVEELTARNTELEAEIVILKSNEG